MDERIQKYEEKMKKTLASLESELVTIRAGRANPHILDKLAVDYYGAPTPLQQVANITVPEARMIQIQPWESSLIKGIEKAILTSDLGLNPSNDGKVIRLVFPELTEERRKELVKDVKKKGEAAKVAVRNIRRDANDAFKKLAKQDVSEDEIKELEEKIQKSTDKYIKEVDAAVDAKSKEIMTCIKVIIISSLTVFICNPVKCFLLRNMLIFLNPFNTVFHIRCINIHAKQLIIILQNLVCTSSHKNAWTFLCQALHCLFLRMKHLLRNRQAFFILRFF